MNILYHIQLHIWGGAEQYVYDLARSMQKRGHTCVFVFQQGCDADLVKRFEPIGKTYILGSLGGLKRFLPYAGRQLQRIIEQNKIDVVHINSRQAYFAMAWARKFSDRKFKTVATQHLVRRAKTSRLWRWAYNRIDTLVCVSKHVEDTYSSDKENNPLFRQTTVVYNSIITDNNLMLQEKPQHEVPVIFYHGRICREKGVFQLIEAAKQISDLPFVLSFAGAVTPSEKEEFMQKIKPLGTRVELLGFRHDIAELAHNATIGVIPSIVAEAGGPLALFENMAYCLPTITTDNGSQTEIITDMENGILYSPDDINKLAQSMRLLICSPELRHQLAKKAQQHFIENFSYENTIARYETIYAQI